MESCLQRSRVSESCVGVSRRFLIICLLSHPLPSRGGLPVEGRECERTYSSTPREHVTCSTTLPLAPACRSTGAVSNCFFAAAKPLEDCRLFAETDTNLEVSCFPPVQCTHRFLAAPSLLEWCELQVGRFRRRGTPQRPPRACCRETIQDPVAEQNIGLSLSVGGPRHVLGVAQNVEWTAITQMKGGGRPAAAGEETGLTQVTLWRPE